MTFDRHEANPDFSRLISQENVQRAQFVTAASGFPGLDRPIIKMLKNVLERGRDEGVFVREIDALDVHMLISSFCFFRINNRYTFAASFGRNLRRTKNEGQTYRDMIGDVVVDVPHHTQKGLTLALRERSVVACRGLVELLL